MSHIEDRWSRPGRHGAGSRWRARYEDLDGRERSRSFPRKGDAERFLTVAWLPVGNAQHGVSGAAQPSQGR